MVQMKIKTKKIVCVVLAVLTVFALLGCSKKDVVRLVAPDLGGSGLGYEKVVSEFTFEDDKVVQARMIFVADSDESAQLLYEICKESQEDVKKDGKNVSYALDVADYSSFTKERLIESFTSYGGFTLE